MHGLEYVAEASNYLNINHPLSCFYSQKTMSLLLHIFLAVLGEKYKALEIPVYKPFIVAEHDKGNRKGVVFQ